MVKFKKKLSLAQKLVLTYIIIILIPFCIVFIENIRNYNENQKKEIIESSLKEIEGMKESFNEKIKIVYDIDASVSNDLELLYFITSGREKNALDYFEFKNRYLKFYDRILTVSTEIIYLKIFTESKNLIEIPPILYNLDGKKTLKKLIDVKAEDNRLILDYWKEIKFLPGNAYLEVGLNLKKIMHLNNGKKFWIITKDKTFLIDDKIENKKAGISYSAIIKNKKEAGTILSGRQIFTYSRIWQIDGYIMEEISTGNIEKNLMIYSINQILLMIISFVGLYYVSKFVILRLFKRLEILIKAVTEIRNGKLDAEIPVDNVDAEFVVFAEQINLMTRRIRELISSLVEKETATKDAQLKALQSQINAHFLQNTIESIKMRAFIGGNYDVSDSLTNLGHILRYGMEWTNPDVTLSDELDYVKKYFNLIAQRLENKIILQVDVPDELLSMKIPKMIIQPLVENSIEHGLIPKEDDGEIKIKIHENDGNVIFEIEDNGIGIEKNSFENGRKNHTGIGINNIATRLNLYFGGVEFSTDSKEGLYTKIMFTVKKRG